MSTLSTIATTILTGSLTLLATMASAQDEPKEVDRLLNSDPQQLMELSQEHGPSKVMTTLADFENRDVREAPANIQVITARQIKASGAQDLYEVLQLVPGLSFGRGENDMIATGMHGNWSEEGRCLFLLDGRPLNENDFGTFGIDQRIPLANVDRIEILMGPASVMHGGFASLGVINIITRSADQGTGTRASLSSGYSGDRITSTMESVSGSHRLSRDQEISYMVSNERGRRSNAIRLLPDSTLLNFGDSTGMRTSTFQFNYRWRQLKLAMAFFEETYHLSNVSYGVQSRAVMFGLRYNARIARKLELSLRMDHSDQLPWQYINTTDPALQASNTENQRTSGRAVLSYKPIDWLTGRLGVDGYYQHSAYSLGNDGEVFNLNNEHSITMTDYAVFGELAVAGKPGMLTGSYRIEHNSLAGNFAAPQFAYTKVLGPMNVKVLWGRSFRIPTVMNLNYTPENEVLQPEYATTKAVELGAKFSKAISATVNLYDTRIQDPVEYVHHPVALDGYRNVKPTGTKGLDARFSWETKRITVLAGLGVNEHIAGATDPELSLADSTGQGYFGLPAQRAFLVVSCDVLHSLTLRAKALWADRKWSYQIAPGPEGDLQLIEWPEELTFNAGLTWRPLNSDRLSIDADVRDLLDTGRTLVNPSTITPPFALNGRTWSMKLIYKFIK